MPLTTSQIHVRRRIAVFGTIGALFVSGLYLPFTLLAPLDPAQTRADAFVSPAAAPVEVSMPTYGASAIGAIGFANDLVTGGAATTLPIASITKIITVLVVLDEHPLTINDPGPIISFSKGDVAIYRKFVAENGKVAPVRDSLTLSQRDVLDVVLIESANNYAESLVIWAFGSEDAFVDRARSWLDAHDLTNTFVADSTGMSPDNVSTAVDLVKLGKVALENPLVSEIVATTSDTIPGIGYVENTNDLLGAGVVTGIKTGTLDEAGACLLFASDVIVGSETVVVVGVVLGAATHDVLNDEVRRLLAEVGTGFTEIELASPGESFASYTTEWGAQSHAVATLALSAVVWSDTPAFLLMTLDEVRVAERGTVIGELVFTVGERTLRSPLALETAIGDPGAWWRLTHPIDLL
ncbi:MAG: D-alanyl-D-alanine carboxypeptidase family protein [Microbacteriaceae bacterium]